MDRWTEGWIDRWIVHNNHGKLGHECVPAHSSQKCDFWQLWISSTWLTWLPARLRWHPRFRLCPSAVSPPKAKSLVSLASFIESLISLVQPLVSVWQTLWQSLVSFLFVTSFLFVPQLWRCFKICKASGTKILRTFTLRVWTLCTTKPAHKNYTVRFFLKVALSYIILYSIIVSTKLGFGPFAWADLKSTKSAMQCGCKVRDIKITPWCPAKIFREFPFSAWVEKHVTKCEKLPLAKNTEPLAKEPFIFLKKCKARDKCWSLGAARCETSEGFERAWAVQNSEDVAISWATCWHCGQLGQAEPSALLCFASTRKDWEASKQREWTFQENEKRATGTQFAVNTRPRALPEMHSGWFGDFAGTVLLRACWHCHEL